MIEEYAPYILIGLKGLLFLLAIGFAVNGLDEFFIDLVKICRDVYRSVMVFGIQRKKPLTEEQLLAEPEQAIAIMIPCWDESAVIRRMLENALSVLNYANYVIFVGAYPNDPATHREVSLVRERYDNVELVICPKDGPTSKADCLNWVFEGIKVYEKERGRRFEIFVMEDSEDILHPLTLKLFNFLIPRVDMVQLPVYPMEARALEFTRGSYMDEFAENHSRDMVVREILCRSIPSAGVGSGLSRSILMRIAEDNHGQLFTIGSVTEDYDFGVRMAEYNVRQIFSRIRFVRTQHGKSRLTGKSRLNRINDYICIREFFPDTFRTAVRQKSRWVVGITLQSWKSIGWVGGFWMRYMLLRDRKSLLTNQLSMIGNALVPFFVAPLAIYYFFPDSYRYPPLVEEGTLLWQLLIFNLGLLYWRMGMRFYYVHAIYGLKHALLSPIRLLWGNVINYCATMRAIRIYLKHMLTGAPIAWDKTDHVFPSEAELRSYRRRLGDLLLERRFVSVAHLDQALERQKRTGQPLGAVLSDMGFVSDDALLQALGIQFSLLTSEVDPYATPLEIIGLIPEKLATSYQVFPIGLAENGAIIVAVSDLPRREDVQELELRLGRSVSLRLTTRGELGFALAHGYQRLKDSQRPTTPLGERLLERGLVTETQLKEALHKQQRAYRRLGDVLAELDILAADGRRFAERSFSVEGQGLRYGEYLVSKGVISSEQLNRALAAQGRHMPLLGDILIEMRAVTPEALQEVLHEVKHNAA